MFRYARIADLDDDALAPPSISAGKRTLTASLPGRPAGAAAAVPTVASPSIDAGPSAHAVQALAAIDEVFSLHLLGDGSAARPADPHAVAAGGMRGGATALPHLETIQRSFGPHDVSAVPAFVGGAAAEASRALGAHAYAAGGGVAFAASPDLHTAAHEAAHVVQQRGGVQLKDGLGRPGDVYERHADAVADRVVSGASAVDLLDGFAGGGSGAGVQLLDDPAAPAAAEPVPAAGGPVPPEVLARAGAQFHHQDDGSAVRHYKVLASGGFEMMSSTAGGVGTTFLPTDAGDKLLAWQVLSAYVVEHATEIPVTVAPVAPVDPATGESPATEPSTLGDLLTGAINAVTGAIQGAIDAGLALFGSVSAIIEAAIGGSPDEEGTPTPADPVVAPADPTGPAAPAPADPDAPLPVLGDVPGAPQAPDGEPLTPTTSAMTASVGEGGDNNTDDVVLVQSRLRELGYPVNATGTVDDATIRAIKLFQAARTASAVRPGQKGSLVSWIDGRIDAGGASAQALMSADAMRFTTISPSGVKPLSKNPQAAYDASTGDARVTWDRLMAIWNRVSPYLVGDANMSSGYRTEADQIRIIEDFYTKLKSAGGYKEQIVATHGEADWQTYVGLTDDASVEIKRQRVKACGQDVAAPGTSPHQSGRAIDVGGTKEADQIHALLRFAIEVDATVVTMMLFEKNTCIHFEFAP